MESPYLWSALAIFYFILLVIWIDAEPRVYAYLVFLTVNSFAAGLYTGEREKK